MIDQTQIRQILAKILESPEFQGSQKYRDLLQFLVEESIAGRQPKETTIGMQIFGKEASFNSKEDATVRVYMNNLRKKLEHYYLSSTDPHTLRLSIPVGHYLVEFVPFDQKHRPSRISTYIPHLLMAAGLVVAFVLGFVVNDFRKAPIVTSASPNPIWNDFVQPGSKHTLLVLGDYFFLREKVERAAYYRRPSINSVEDFQFFSSTEPILGKVYQPNDFTFLRPSGPLSMTKILPIIQHSPGGYSLKLASEFTPTDFKGNNVIFVGTFKTLGSFKKFLHIFKMERTTSQLGTPSQYESISIRGEADDSTRTYSIGGPRSGDYVRDFSFIAKGAGPEGCTILMILGFTENGVIAGANAACDSGLYRAIKTTYEPAPPKDAFNFTLVLGSEGIAGAIFNTDVRYFVIHRSAIDQQQANRTSAAPAK